MSDNALQRAADWLRASRRTVVLTGAGLLHGVATQNVDGFHQAAGSERVAELHGSLRTARCHGCGRHAEPAAFAGGFGRT